MTQRQRPVVRTRRQTFLHSEDRQTFLVTAFFVGIIVLVSLFLVGALGLAYYNENLRPVASVGNVELGPGMVRERGALLRNRILLEQNRITAGMISGEVDSTRGSQRQTELSQQLQELNVLAVEGLIDVVYQNQLAAERGITVGESEIDERMADELATPERRHVLAIIIEPETADPDGETTVRERRAARERAEQALAALEAGGDFAEVAREHSTHESRENGGDLGLVSELAPDDELWRDELFALEEGGTTDVLADAQGSYRIGRVIEIQRGGEEPGARTNLLQNISEQRYREFVGYELAAEKLEREVLDETLATPVEQLNLAEIFIDATTDTGDELADQGEIHFSEIVYAPNDSVDDAPELPADDPAWDAAQAEAEQTHAELAAIEEPAQLEERFAQIALDESDSPSTGPEGGDSGYLTRGLVPEPVGVALWDAEHEPGDLIDPVRSDAGYVILLFHDKREVSPPSEERLQVVKDALAQPGADFAEIAREHSDSDTAEDGGELGWFSRLQMGTSVGEELFALEVGETSDSMELGDGYFIFKVLDRQERPLDADQQSEARRHIAFGNRLLWSAAFERWYSERKDEAERNQVIRRTDDLDEDVDLEPDFDLDDLDEDVPPFDDDELPPDLELPEDGEELPTDELEE